MRTLSVLAVAGLSVGVCYAQPPADLATSLELCTTMYNSAKINGEMASNEFDRAYADCQADGKGFACSRALELTQHTMHFFTPNSTQWDEHCFQVDDTCKGFTKPFLQMQRDMLSALAQANRQCPAGDAKCADSLKAAVHHVRDVTFYASKGSIVCATAVAPYCFKALAAGGPSVDKVHSTVEAAMGSCRNPPKDDCSSKLDAVDAASRELDPYAKTVSASCDLLPSRDCKVDEDYENTLGSIFRNLKKARDGLSAGHYADMYVAVESMQASATLLEQYTKDGPVDCKFPTTILQ